jgi:hypothetical protein
MVAEHRLRLCHKVSQQVAPRPFGKKSINGSVGDIMRWSAVGLESVFSPSYLTYMSVAYTWIELNLIAAKLLVQARNESPPFVGTDMPTTVAPHPPFANSHQIAAKNGLSFLNGKTHTTTLDGTPASIIHPGVIT